MAQVASVPPQEIDQLRSGLEAEAEDDAVLDAVLGGVAADPSQHREALRHRAVDRLQVALLQLRKNALARRGQPRDVSPHVALVSAGQIDDGGASPQARGLRG